MKRMNLMRYLRQKYRRLYKDEKTAESSKKTRSGGAQNSIADQTIFQLGSICSLDSFVNFVLQRRQDETDGNGKKVGCAQTHLQWHFLLVPSNAALP